MTPCVPPFQITQGHRTDTDRSATSDFLLKFHSNHGPISYRFRNKRRFRKFPHDIPYITLHDEGVHFGIVYRRSESKKTRMMGYRTLADPELQFRGPHGERGARAYNGGLGAESLAGSRGRAPGQGVRERSPLKLKA